MTEEQPKQHTPPEPEIPWARATQPAPSPQSSAEAAPPILVCDQALPYHRLAFTDLKTQWWKPLVEAAIGVPIFLVLSLLVAVSYMAHLFSISTASLDLNLETLQSQSLVSPATFLMVFLSVVIMWPALLIARLCMGPKPWGLIHSVRGRIRWSWLFLSAAIALIFYVIFPTVMSLLGGEALIPQPSLATPQLVIMLALVLLIVPFQCYAEELVFRGYLMQTLGRWLKNPVWAITLPAIPFMFGHAYDFWGQASILTMGLATGFLAWYTGGLEAGIAFHTVNNLYLMVLGTLGLVDPFAQDGSTFINFAVSTAMQLLFVFAVIYAARKVGLERTATYRVRAEPMR